MKTIKHDLILTKDTIFNESITVKGNIRGYYNLTVRGDIDAGDINARNIDVWDINAGNINAGNINAGDINARNIDVWDIICEKRIKKTKTSKTIARIFIQDRFKLVRKEW